ncbi:MAG: AbrB/MazE/SpoVT family DNA-binding domain-containing protein [Dehalococcoidia bacterium]
MPRMNARGQVTIPADIRERLGFHPGAEVEFAAHNDGIYVRVIDSRPRPTWEEARARVESVRGSATNKSMTTDEIMRMFRGDDWGRD